MAKSPAARPSSPAPFGTSTASFATLRNAVVFIAVVVALALVRFFQEILTPLVVAIFLLLLIDAVARVMQERLPTTPDWVRGGIAGAVILASFGAVGGLFVLEGPPFAGEIQGIAPRLNHALVSASTLVGARPMTIEQIFSGGDPSRIIARVFSTARGLVSYGFLVIIYFGFLVASRAAFGKKVDRLYESDAARTSARRVLAAVRNAVEQYVRLQTLKALMIAITAWVLMAIMGVRDGLFVAFVVFLAAYVPIVGAIAGSVFPGLVYLAQYDDPLRAGILVAVLGSAVFVIDNVIMPKLQSDELNIDPLLVLISIGFWGAMMGVPGVLLSTPLTVTVMAIAAEFPGTRWLAILISRDGHPIHDAKSA
ncbi:MAG TPA: AI-2E family transporter [Caulobacteraceae bacterium]|nr:AI-2E family transporter [Caulobacteraceae bacterium]